MSACPYLACVWSDDANDAVTLLRVITGDPGRTGAKGETGVRGVPGGIHTGLLTGNVTLVYNIYSWASELILEWGVEVARPEEPRVGDGVLGEGTASPSPPTRGFAGAL